MQHGERLFVGLCKHSMSRKESHEVHFRQLVALFDALDRDLLSASIFQRCERGATRNTAKRCHMTPTK